MRKSSSTKSDAKLLKRSLPADLSRADLRKLSIIKAFIDCVAQHGLAQATFEKLGARIKMKAPHVAYYFPDREQLLAGAIRFVVAKGQEATLRRIDSATDDHEALCAMVNGAFDWWEEDPRYFTIMMLFYHLASFDPVYRDMHTEIRLTGEARIAALLSRLRTDLPSKSLAEIARNIQGVITGNLIGWATIRSAEPAKEARSRTIESVLQMARR